MPDYGQPGNDGGSLKGRRPRQQSLVYTGPRLVAPGGVFDCCDGFTLVIRVQQTLPASKMPADRCAQFDFEPLWRLLESHGRDRTDAFRCTRECPKKQRTLFWALTCEERTQPKRHFELAVEAHVSVRCEASDCDEHPGEEIASPGEADFKGPRSAGDPGLPLQPVITITEEAAQGRDDLDRLKCPSKGYMHLRYVDLVPSCNRLNFRPYVRHAEARAEDWFDHFSCRSHCGKEDFETLRVEWDCVPLPVPAAPLPQAQLALVVVDVYFMVECK
jgi:hypothetical protein